MVLVPHTGLSPSSVVTFRGEISPGLAWTILVDRQQEVTIQLELALGLVVTVRLELSPYVLVLTLLGFALGPGTSTKN